MIKLNRVKQAKHLFLKLFIIVILVLQIKNATKDNNFTAYSLTTETYQDKYIIEPYFENKLKASILQIYGPDELNSIYNNVKQIIVNTRNSRSEELKIEDNKRSSDWYKDEIIYMFYADQFGIQKDNKTNSFKDTAKMLDYLSDLGVTTIYILPFMDSPMGDAGFDIKNPREVRQDLGGIKEFKVFIEEARKKNIKIKADLVLNHFSDQHEWFKQALNGDSEKLNYFVYTTEKPKYKKITDKDLGTIINYQEKDGSISSRRLMFPDICEDHFREVNINGKKVFFYHTFYPFQIDINWKNPQVLYEILKIIGFWSNMGIDIFRFDATAFLIKEPGTNAENLPETLEIIQLLSTFLKAVSPKSVIQGEVANNISKYFGEEENFPISKDKTLLRTDKVQIAYDFPLMGSMWAALIKKNKKYFWDNMNDKEQLPESSTWGRFLRVHDELTLEAVSPEVREEVYKEIINKGKDFRNGLGISGRLSNFLDNDNRRISLAFSILLSIPGTPIIYYGDEIGGQNNLDYATKSAEYREQNQKKNLNNKNVISFYDSRDINRGPIKYGSFYKAMNEESNELSNSVHKSVKEMISARKSETSLRRGNIKEVPSNNSSVLSYLREKDKDKILIINNLSEQQTNVILTPQESLLQEIQQNKSINVFSNKPIPIETDNGCLKIQLKPYEYLWIKLNNS